MTTTYSFYDFLSGCGGNWRNAIFLSCASCAHPCASGGSGYLLTSDSMGKPLLLSVNSLEKLIGQRIDPAECIGQLNRSAFEALYHKHLLWQLDSARVCPFPQLAALINTIQ